MSPGSLFSGNASRQTPNPTAATPAQAPTLDPFYHHATKLFVGILEVTRHCAFLGTLKEQSNIFSEKLRALTQSPTAEAANTQRECVALVRNTLAEMHKSAAEPMMKLASKAHSADLLQIIKEHGQDKQTRLEEIVKENIPIGEGRRLGLGATNAAIGDNFQRLTIEMELTVAFFEEQVRNLIVGHLSDFASKATETKEDRPSWNKVAENISGLYNKSCTRTFKEPIDYAHHAALLEINSIAGLLDAPRFDSNVASVLTKCALSGLGNCSVATDAFEYLIPHLRPSLTRDSGGAISVTSDLKVSYQAAEALGSYGNFTNLTCDSQPEAAAAAEQLPSAKSVAARERALLQLSRIANQVSRDSKSPSAERIEPYLSAIAQFGWAGVSSLMKLARAHCNQPELCCAALNKIGTSLESLTPQLHDNNRLKASGPIVVTALALFEHSKNPELKMSAASLAHAADPTHPDVLDLVQKLINGQDGKIWRAVFRYPQLRTAPAKPKDMFQR